MNNQPFRPFVVDVAREDDLDGVLALTATVASEGRWIASEPPIDSERRRERLLGFLGRQDAIVLVAATDAREIVGELVLVPQWPGLLQLGMLVAPAWRRRGVGGALLREGIVRARDLGAHKIALEVFPHNTAAVDLYERHGFVREGYFRAHLRRTTGELWDTIPMGLLLREG